MPLYASGTRAGLCGHEMVEIRHVRGGVAVALRAPAMELAASLGALTFTVADWGR
jgi:hypothetical protein